MKTLPSVGKVIWHFYFCFIISHLHGRKNTDFPCSLLWTVSIFHLGISNLSNRLSHFLNLRKQFRKQKWASKWPAQLKTLGLFITPNRIHQFWRLKKNADIEMHSEFFHIYMVISFLEWIFLNIEQFILYASEWRESNGNRRSQE